MDFDRDWNLLRCVVDTICLKDKPQHRISKAGHNRCKIELKKLTVYPEDGIIELEREGHENETTQNCPAMLYPLSSPTAGSGDAVYR
jgi:hypothetical protein